MSVQEIAQGIIADHGAGTYQCECGGSAVDLTGYPEDVRDDLALMVKVIEHSLYDHISAHDVHRVEIKSVLAGGPTRRKLLG